MNEDWENDFWMSVGLILLKRDLHKVLPQLSPECHFIVLFCLVFLSKCPQVYQLKPKMSNKLKRLTKIICTWLTTKLKYLDMVVACRKPACSPPSTLYKQNQVEPIAPCQTPHTDIDSRCTQSDLDQIELLYLWAAGGSHRWGRLPGGKSSKSGRHFPIVGPLHPPVYCQRGQVATAPGRQRHDSPLWLGWRHWGSK